MKISLCIPETSEPSIFYFLSSSAAPLEASSPSFLISRSFTDGRLKTYIITTFTVYSFSFSVYNVSPKRTNSLRFTKFYCYYVLNFTTYEITTSNSDHLQLGELSRRRMCCLRCLSPMIIKLFLYNLIFLPLFLPKLFLYHCVDAISGRFALPATAGCWYAAVYTSNKTGRCCCSITNIEPQPPRFCGKQQMTGIPPRAEPVSAFHYYVITGNLPAEVYSSR